MIAMFLSIGEVAKRTGLAISAIRYYEARGLLPKAMRSQGNRREYGAETVERLRFIGSCRANGMGLDEIGGLLILLHEPGDKCGEARGILQGAIGNITARIVALQDARRTLSGVVSACNDAACKALPEGCNIAPNLR